MSLYIGEDNTGSNILHLTKNNVNQNDIKNGFIYNSTVFLSSASIFEVVYTSNIAVPSATTNTYGSVALGTTLSGYLNNSAYTVFMYVVDGSNNASSAFYSDMFYFRWGTGNFTVANTSTANNGKTLLFVVAALVSNSLEGKILLSKNSIKFGSIDLALKKFIAFSTTAPSAVASYSLWQNGFMYIVDAIDAESFLFSSTAIQYKKSGVFYDFISVGISSRVHSYISFANSGIIGTHYDGRGISYDGQICKHSLPSIADNTYQQIHASFTYPFYYAEGWSGGGDTSSFNINVTFSSNESKLLGFALTPFMGFIIEWNHISKMFYYGAIRFTNDIELQYTGTTSPVLMLKAI